MKLSALIKTSVIATAFAFGFLAFATTSVAAEGRCCFLRGTSPEKCTTQCFTDRQVKNDCTGNGTNVPGGCYTCGPTEEATACGGSSTPSNPGTCTQSIYALENPTNMTIGQTKDFYADGRATNGIFSRMVATVVNVPTSTPAIATVVKTSGPTCYANGNCRQGFRLTAKSNGTARIRVATLVRLCPACGETGFCERFITLNVGAVTPRSCKPGAACKLTARSLGCTMPTLSSGELAGGTASYQVECTPYKAAVAQAKIARSSATGTLPAITMATGVTNVKCSFRHCVTATTGVTTCSNWGKAS